MAGEAIEPTTGELVELVTLLGAAVITVPLFRRLGLGSVLGYLAAGVLIGPFGFGWFSDPESILHVAELGVVMFLFVIGLEMRPSHLWALRREIFVLGALQVAICAALLTCVARFFGFSTPSAFIGAMGFVLTSTAVVMQVLEERGDITLPRGQKVVSILLLEDLLIVPLLALVSVMSPELSSSSSGAEWHGLGVAAASLAALLAAGTWLLNPLFRLLAAAKAREILTAAALLVVLGAALLMQLGGLSMAMGAFLAGVMLSQSSFRHQIEADIEPFRGILLGLFFLGVGMSLDLGVVRDHYRLILSLVVAMALVKGLGIYFVARLLRSSRSEALDRAVLMAQGGEFAFVLYAAATAAKVIVPEENANFTAVVILSMTLTPLVVIGIRRLAPKRSRSIDGVDVADGLTGSVLLIGFGRFGQVVSQALLARDVDVTIIDNDVDMIQSAEGFGFKVYYGDGTRLDVLRASGAETARAIAVCVNDKKAATQITHIAREAFPQARLLVRSFDRQHAHELVTAGVDYQIRETFESAMQFGAQALRELGISEDEVEQVILDVRRRDEERFELETAGGPQAGRALLRGNLWKPTPLVKPRRAGKPVGSEPEHEKVEREIE